MKMRRHRVFLLCTVGLCVISFLHYYKALHYVSLLRELSAPYPNIKSFIMVSGFFWREKGLAATPLSPASPEEAPPLPGVREFDTKPEIGSDATDERHRDELAPPHPWEKPKDTLNEVRWMNNCDPACDLHSVTLYSTAALSQCSVFVEADYKSNFNPSEIFPLTTSVISSISCKGLVCCKNS